MAALDLRDVKDLFGDLRREMQDNHRELLARIEAIEAGDGGGGEESSGPPEWVKPFVAPVMEAIQRPGGLDLLLNTLIDRVRTRIMAPPVVGAPPAVPPGANGAA